MHKNMNIKLSLLKLKLYQLNIYIIIINRNILYKLN